MSALTQDVDSTAKPASSVRLQNTLAVAALVSVGVLLTVTSFRSISNSDFWWQYSTGRLVAQQGIPQSDVLSYTRLGEEWIELRWLFCYGVYYMMEWIGPAGVILAQWLAMAAAFTLLITCQSSRRTLTVTAFVVMIAVLGSSQRFQSRPELVTFLLLAVFIWIIERIQSGRTRWLYALPILQIVWVNSHTVFVLGPLIVAIWLAAEIAEPYLRRGGGMNETTGAVHKKRIVLAAGGLLATLLACLVNPYGFRGLAFPLQLATQIHTTEFKKYIAEFATTFDVSHTLFAVVFFEILLGLCMISVLLNLRRVNFFILGIALFTGYLAVTAVRNLPLFCLAAVPLIVQNFADSPIWNRRLAERCLPVGRVVVCVAVIAGSLLTSWTMITDRFNVWQNDTSKFGLAMAPNRYPLVVARYLKEQAPKGPLFNTMMEGSFLTAYEIPVFIDPRLEVYGEPFFEAYMRMISVESEWKAAAVEHGFRVAVMHLTSLLVGFLHHDPDWSLVCFDEVAALFVHRESLGELPVIGRDIAFEDVLADIRPGLPKPTPIRETPWHRRVSSPFPAHDVAVFLYNVGQYTLAEPLIDDAIRIQPTQSSLHRMRAVLMDRLGRLDEAIASYERTLESSPNDPEILSALGRRYFSRNDHSRARPLLEQSLAAYPNNATNWALLSRIHLDAQKLNDALAAIRRAVEVDPRSVMFRKDLAKIHGIRRELDQMVREFMKAAEMAPQDCTIWRDLAVVFAEYGRIEDARRYLQQAPPLCMNDPQIIELRNRLAE